MRSPATVLDAGRRAAPSSVSSLLAALLAVTLVVSACGPAPIGHWTEAGQMNSLHLWGTATVLEDGRVLVAGDSDVAELYDSATGQFTPTGSMITSRWELGSALLADGRVLFVGGTHGGAEALASTEVYDPVTGVFRVTGSMAETRSEPLVIPLPDGGALVAGGGAGGKVIATAELFDPKSAVFRPTGSMSVARAGATATVLADGRVLVAGGMSEARNIASAEIYDPRIGVFTPTGSMSVARVGHTATLLADGRVLIAGGYDDGRYLSSAELFDPASGTFSPTASMAAARWRGTATRLKDGKVLLAGGIYGEEKFTDFRRAVRSRCQFLRAGCFHAGHQGRPSGRTSQRRSRPGPGWRRRIAREPEVSGALLGAVEGTPGAVGLRRRMSPDQYIVPMRNAMTNMMAASTIQIPSSRLGTVTIRGSLPDSSGARAKLWPVATKGPIFVRTSLQTTAVPSNSGRRGNPMTGPRMRVSLMPEPSWYPEPHIQANRMTPSAYVITVNWDTP